MERENESFTVFTLDLVHRRFRNITKLTDRSLPAFADRCLEHVRPASQKSRGESSFSTPTGLQHANFRSDLTQKTLLTILAWRCEQSALRDRRMSLVNRASELAPSNYLKYSPYTLVACIQDDLSFVTAARIPWRVGDAAIPFDVLVSEIEWCMKHFPEHPVHNQYHRFE